jgi:hypothetical protein
MKKGDCSQPQLATHSWPIQGRTTFYWLNFHSFINFQRNKQILRVTYTLKTLLYIYLQIHKYMDKNYYGLKCINFLKYSILVRNSISFILLQGGSFLPVHSGFGMDVMMCLIYTRRADPWTWLGH